MSEPALRPIDAAPFRKRLGDLCGDPGPLPTLQWIAIDRLRVDDLYQRQIQERGAGNVRRIAEAFDWSKFTPVIVARAGQDDAGALYAIIDGQHRTTAAALRGLIRVPCEEVEADRARQAAAFAAINGSVTALSSMQIFHAKLAAGDRDAATLAAVLQRAGVSICRSNTPAHLMQPGETLAVTKLRRLHERHGEDVLVAALECVTRTRDGNPGWLRQQIVEALCAVLDAEPSWRADRAALLAAMQSFDFAAAYKAAGEKSYRYGEKLTTALIEFVLDHLVAELGVADAVA